MEEHTYFRPASGRLLQQSVLKHVRRRAEGVEEGAAFGYDAAIFQNRGKITVQAVGCTTTGRFTAGTSVSAEEAAWITAENQLATADAVPRNVQVLLTAAKDCPEEMIRRIMQNLTRMAQERNCPIVGGNTVHFGEGCDCLIQLVMTGSPREVDREKEENAAVPPEKDLSDRQDISPEMPQERLVARRKPVPGDEVYFLGEAGCLGAELLAVRRHDDLRQHFAEGYIREMRYLPEDFSVRDKAERARRAGAVFLHDVSGGGVHGALYQLAEAAGGGIEIRHEGLTIRQSVIELSEVLGINPYLLLGTGGLLAVVPGDQTEHWEEAMTGAPFAWNRAAVITKEKARIVKAEHFPMRRFLNLPEGDALEEGL